MEMTKNFMDNSLIVAKLFFFEAGGCSFTSQIVSHFNSSVNYKNRVIGIRDADFSHLTNYDPIDNLFLTDTHDWETMAIKGTGSLQKVCLEMSMPYDPNLYSTIMEHLKPLSYIRLYNCLKQSSNARYNGINFKGLKLQYFYDGKEAIDLNKCLDKLKENNVNMSPFPNKDDIQQLYCQYGSVDLYQLTRGHDIVHAIQLKYCCLNKKNSNLGEKEISCILRTAYTYADFQQTKLYNDIDTWATSRGLNLWTS